MESGLKRSLDKFELYVLRNILTVPDNIDELLKEDEQRKEPQESSSLDPDEMFALDKGMFIFGACLSPVLSSQNDETLIFLL